MNLDFKNKLVNGNSFKRIEKIPDEAFDLIFRPSLQLTIKKQTDQTR